MFARIDHKPTGFFIKGMVGLGTVVDGEIIDRDFFLGQFTFSDTTSNVKDGSLKFAMFDVGWSYSPVGGVKLGFFAGYHYWYEKVTAYGLVCNQASILGCTFPGEVQVGFDTAVLRISAHLARARIGFIGQIALTERLSFSARDRRHSVCVGAEQGQPSAAAELCGPWAGAEHHRQQPVCGTAARPNCCSITRSPPTSKSAPACATGV